MGRADAQEPHDFAGVPVVNYVNHALDDADLVLDMSEYPEAETLRGPDVGTVAWRLASGYDGPPFKEVFGGFLDGADTEHVRHLVFGYTGDSDADWVDPVPLLVDAADRFPGLRTVFLGDTWEELEISWIEQGDITPLLEAFPALEHVQVRGAQGMESDGLTLAPFEHAALKSLRFESGGLPAGVVRALGASDLPALESLVMWLGTANYGGDAVVNDLAGVLTGERLPSLRHLGLEDSEIADEVAAAVAGAPVVARLESLSMALGMLTDTGAEALLGGQPLTHLTTLDLHHHFVSPPMRERFHTVLPGVEIDLTGEDGSGRDWFTIAVAE